MNYHNFISRLSIRRAPTANAARETPKGAPKKALRAPRRRGRSAATAAAAALWVFLTVLMPHSAVAAGGADDAAVSVHHAWLINMPTLIITVAGVAVALWRIPVLWRRDVEC